MQYYSSHLHRILAIFLDILFTIYEVLLADVAPLMERNGKLQKLKKFKPFVNIRIVVIKLKSPASILQCLVDKFLLSVLISRCFQLRLEICCF